MSITTYSELVTATERWIGGSDNSDGTSLGVGSMIGDLITIGESRLLRETKTKDTEQSFSTAIASGVIAVPSDYIATKYFYVNNTPVKFLEPRPVNWILENYPTRSGGSVPRFFARDGTNFIFGPFPDSTYTVSGVYYRRLPALSTGVNNLFLNNPDLYLFACLAEAGILIGPDSRIPIWESKYKSILDSVNGLSRNSEYAGGSLQIKL